LSPSVNRIWQKYGPPFIEWYPPEFETRLANVVGL